MLSVGFSIFTWGCPCRKGGRPQTWAWEAGCWGWWGRGWSSQTVPTWPAAICGICMIRKVISLDNFQRYQVYSRNENYLQEILTVFIKWIVKRYFEGDKKETGCGLCGKVNVESQHYQWIDTQPLCRCIIWGNCTHAERGNRVTLHFLDLCRRSTLYYKKISVIANLFENLKKYLFSDYLPFLQQKL